MCTDPPDAYQAQICRFHMSSMQYLMGDLTVKLDMERISGNYKFNLYAKGDILSEDSSNRFVKISRTRRVISKQHQWLSMHQTVS